MNIEHTPTDYAVAKGVTAATAAATSWTFSQSVELLSQLGAAAGALVAIWIFSERLWARIVRPFCVRRKWLRPLKRRQADGRGRVDE